MKRVLFGTLLFVLGACWGVISVHIVADPTPLAPPTRVEPLSDRDLCRARGGIPTSEPWAGALTGCVFKPDCKEGR